jgi:hypothetical protein
VSTKVGNHFSDKRRSLGRYSSLANSDHGVFFLFYGSVREPVADYCEHKLTFEFHKWLWNSSVTDWLTASEGGLTCMKLVG